MNNEIILKVEYISSNLAFLLLETMVCLHLCNYRQSHLIYIIYQASNNIFILSSYFLYVHLLASTKVFHELGGTIVITRWGSLWAIHEWPTSLRAAAWLSVISVVALIVWSIRTVVSASHTLGSVIAHGEIIWATHSTVLIAAWWMAILVTVVVRRVGTDAADRRWRRLGRLGMQ